MSHGNSQPPPPLIQPCHTLATSQSCKPDNVAISDIQKRQGARLQAAGAMEGGHTTLQVGQAAIVELPYVFVNVVGTGGWDCAGTGQLYVVPHAVVVNVHHCPRLRRPAHMHAGA